MEDFEIILDAKSVKVQLSLGQLKQITNTAIRNGFFQLGVIAKEVVLRHVMALPRYGRLYNRPGNLGKKHRASRPGEAFANMTGAAKNTLGYDVKGSDYLEFGFRDNANTEYVKWLEEGTKNISPRPTLQLASIELQGIGQTLLESEVLKSHELAAEGKLRFVK